MHSEFCQSARLLLLGYARKTPCSEHRHVECNITSSKSFLFMRRIRVLETAKIPRNTKQEVIPTVQANFDSTMNHTDPCDMKAFSSMAAKDSQGCSASQVHYHIKQNELPIQCTSFKAAEADSAGYKASIKFILSRPSSRPFKDCIRRTPISIMPRTRPPIVSDMR